MLILFQRAITVVTKRCPTDHFFPIKLNGVAHQFRIPSLGPIPEEERFVLLPVRMKIYLSRTMKLILVGFVTCITVIRLSVCPRLA